MIDQIKTPFSREAIEAKQAAQREEYKKSVDELRKTFELVAATPSGEKLLQYIFLLCGGDTIPLRQNHDKEVAVNDTLVVLGAKGVWDTMRFAMTSDTLKKIERHNWEQ